jgi:hypothetical protein
VHKRCPTLGYFQGDQIGRIFAYWMIVFFGYYFENFITFGQQNNTKKVIYYVILILKKVLGYILSHLKKTLLLKKLPKVNNRPILENNPNLVTLLAGEGENSFFCLEIQPATVQSRVARCFIFIPKIPIWVYYGGPWNGKCWERLSKFGIHSCHLVYFISIFIDFVFWYIFPFWCTYCIQKNLATLAQRPNSVLIVITYLLIQFIDTVERSRTPQ